MYKYVTKAKEHLKKNEFVFSLFQKIYHHLVLVVKSTGIKFRYYAIVPEKKLIYLINYKVASSSILSSLLGKEVLLEDNIHLEARLLLKERLILNSKEKKYYKFTFVRNPYTRLLSCYKNKVLNEKNNKRSYFKQNMFGFLADVSSFEEFIYKVCEVPDRISDVHFVSQYYYVFSNNKPIVDFIGKFEDLAYDYLHINEKYKLKPLSHYNKTSNTNWMDYYSLNTAELVFKRYKDDFEQFGYMGEYNNLISYLNSKEV